MLYITTIHGKEFEWHVGETVPEIAVASIAELQADLHELEHIQKLFDIEEAKGTHFTIPMPNKRVCRWYGDLARTIYLNL